MKKKFYNDREERLSWVFRRFKREFKESKSILDIGCDNKQLKKYVSNKKYLGIDMTENADKVINLDEISKLPFKSNSFDLIVCTDVLEHLENFHLIFDEICRVANKYVIITLPNPVISFFGYFFKIKTRKDNGQFGKFSKYYGLPLEKPLDRHRWFFCYDEVVDFLKYKSKKKKFKIKSIETDYEYRSRNILKKIVLFIVYKINRNFVYNDIVILIEK